MSNFCDLGDSVKINKHDDEFVKQVKIDTIINECSKKFSTVIVTKLIGTGTYGKVYLANADYENKNIGIAIKHIHIITDVAAEQYGIDDEYSVFKKMSELGLSPQLYEGIDFETNEGEANKVIIMEKFDIDCHTLFIRDGFTFVLKKQILSDIVELVTKTVKAGISCIDMKLGNFMYKQEGQVVKMIDFGEYCSYTDEAKGKLMYDQFEFTELCKKFVPEDTPEENKNAFQLCEIVFNLIIIKYIMFNSQIIGFLMRYYESIYEEDGEQYTTLKELSDEEIKKRNKAYYEISLLNRHILQIPIMKAFLGTPKYICYFMAFIFPTHPLAFNRNKVLTHYCREALGYTDENPVRENYDKNDIRKIIMLDRLDDSIYAKNVKVFMDYGKKEFKSYVQQNLKPGKRSPPGGSGKKRRIMINQEL